MAAFNSPVWFNVGFEESPQCSACQPYHALVSTPEGMVPIGELVEGRAGRSRGLRRQRRDPVVAVKANGRKPVWRVRLRNGSFIEATPDHVVKAVAERRTASRAWLRVDQLEVGMRLHLHPHRAKVERSDRCRGRARSGPSVFDDELEADRQRGGRRGGARRLASGRRLRRPVRHGTNRSLTIEFQVASDDEYEWVTSHLDVVFPDVHRKVREADTEHVRVQRIRLYGEVLRDFVERWGAAGARGRHPGSRPAVDRVARRDQRYLQSVFQADGYVSVRRWRLRERAHRLRGDRRALDRGPAAAAHLLGIYSRRQHKVDPADRHDLTR
jgi:ribonucleoside-diphosphate reductase alpha chain